jgi:diaminopimelate decarboxylase
MPMSSFFPYRNGWLQAEDLPLHELAAEVGTPFYCYSSSALEESYRRFATALAPLDPTICYALKANGNLAVIASFAKLGAGADVVSEGELRRALAAGVPVDKIVFAGVGKTEAEMAFALDCGILQFNVESLPELETLSRVAASCGTQAPVALRINPDVDAKTHAHITTGRAENKFGVDIAKAEAACKLARDLPGIRLQGLAVHIGSQLTDLEPFRQAFVHLAELCRSLRAAGFEISHLDLGGGLGIAYGDEPGPDVEGYAEIARDCVGGLGAKLVFEPGRHLVGNAGLLITRVLYVKRGDSKRFIVVDAGMNDLIRPVLYDAWHGIEPVHAVDSTVAVSPADVVGPICETADSFASQRLLPELAAGDFLAIKSAGAYGAVMSSSYNGRPPAPEVLVKANRYEIVRPRPSHEDLMRGEVLPDWI